MLHANAFNYATEQFELFPTCGYVAPFYIREHIKLVRERHPEIRDEADHQELVKNWPGFLISVDVWRWTLGWKHPILEQGKWQYTRLSLGIREISGEVVTLFRQMMAMNR